MRSPLLHFTILTVVLSPICCAKNLGVHGPVFLIEERNLLEVIQDKLHNLEKSGKIAEINSQIIEKVKQKVLNPTPLDLPTVTEYKSKLFDPTFVVKKDIKDHLGQVIAHKGTKINPLDHFSWRTPIILINGEDSDQLEWAKTITSNLKSTGKPKWVLIKGSPFEISKAHNGRVYFDQGGRITKHFGIEKVPTKISQQGKVLILEEIPPIPQRRS